MNTYKSIFISDLHLGTKHAQAEKYKAGKNLYFAGNLIVTIFLSFKGIIFL